MLIVDEVFINTCNLFSKGKAPELSDSAQGKKNKTIFLQFSKQSICNIKTIMKKYSSVFRENRCPPPPKPVYGGNFSHEAVTLKIRSRTPKSNKLLILSDLFI